MYREAAIELAKFSTALMAAIGQKLPFASMRNLQILPI
jgi:hypothetical protein